MAEKETLRADFTMGQHDYERYHHILKSLDQVSLKVRSENLDFLKPYHALLEELFINWYPLMEKEKRKTLKELLRKCRNEINKWFNQKKKTSSLNINFPLDIIKDLTEVHIELMVTKQEKGLGISVSKTEEKSKKLKRLIQSG